MKKTVANLCMILPLITACAAGPAFADDNHNNSQRNATFEFALIGDTPYGVLPGEKNQAFDDLVEDINTTHHLKWVLHAGDIKAGSTPCSDEMFYDRLNRYSQFKRPFVMTLGDNEWTDCHRVAAGEYQPLERLAKLREVFFSTPGRTLGKKSMRVTSQANMAGYEEFPENVMWTRKQVIFSTIHIIGSHNGLDAFDPASSAVRTQADDDEVVRRTQAALMWLDKAFVKAEEIDAPGVFIMIHADPGLERGDNDRTGFVEFLTSLEQHALNYGKPVVLAHGDSHYFRVDKPALVNMSYMDNFTRVETFGSSKVNWVRVKVDPNSKEVFSFKQEIVQ